MATEKKILVYSPSMKNGLDDDYTLYDTGEVLHEYDDHIFPGGQNRTRILKASELKESVKERLLKAGGPDNSEVIKSLMKI